MERLGIEWGSENTAGQSPSALSGLPIRLAPAPQSLLRLTLPSVDFIRRSFFISVQRPAVGGQEVCECLHAPLESDKVFTPARLLELV